MTRRRRDPRAETLALTTSTQPRRRIARGTPAPPPTGRRRRDPRAERAGASVQVGTRRRFDWSGAALSQSRIHETASPPAPPSGSSKTPPSSYSSSPTSRAANSPPTTVNSSPPAASWPTPEGEPS